jgi:ketosteroid isomerase-like protein
MTEQETKAEVKQAVIDSYRAWRERDTEGYRRHTHPDTYGYYTDGGLLSEGSPDGLVYEGVQAWWKAGQRSTLSPSHIAERLLGSDAAIATSYAQGSEIYPGGRSIEGTWRVTSVMVREDGTWKGIHYHFSPLTTSQTERKA